MTTLNELENVGAIAPTEEAFVRIWENEDWWKETKLSKVIIRKQDEFEIYDIKVNRKSDNALLGGFVLCRDANEVETWYLTCSECYKHSFETITYDGTIETVIAAVVEDLTEFHKQKGEVA